MCIISDSLLNCTLCSPVKELNSYKKYTEGMGHTLVVEHVWPAEGLVLGMLS